MALRKRENEALREQLEAIKPRKRRRVVTDPNSATSATSAGHKRRLAVEMTLLIALKMGNPAISTVVLKCWLFVVKMPV
jgi:hypothetical protein